MKKSLRVEYKNSYDIIYIIIHYAAYNALVYRIEEDTLYANGEYEDCSQSELITGVTNREKTARLIYLLHKYFNIPKIKVYNILQEIQ